MKKILAIFICSVLLFSISASSFAVLDEDGFVFQYGNRWGQTPGEVYKSIINSETAKIFLTEYDDHGKVSEYYVQSINFMGYYGTYIHYFFENEALYSAAYRIAFADNAARAKYVLDKMYGKSEPADDQWIVFHDIYSNGVYNEEINKNGVNELLKWELEDGTIILLADIIDDPYLLIYYNFNFCNLDTSAF